MSGRTRPENSSNFPITAEVGLGRELLPNLLTAGWALEKEETAPSEDPELPTGEELRQLIQQTRRVDLHPVFETYVDAVGKIRDLGVAVSDRRAIKIMKLIAASAVLCDRAEANLSDLWVLRYIWDRAEQITPLNNLVAGLLNQSASTASHPRALLPERVDPETLATELEQAASQLATGMKLIELARLRDRVQGLGDRATWVEDSTAREHLLKIVRELLEKLG